MRQGFNQDLTGISDRLLVKQISPDKNIGFPCTAAAFTVAPWIGVSCRLAHSPRASAFYAISVRQLAGLLAASSARSLAVTHLPFASSSRLMSIKR